MKNLVAITEKIHVALNNPQPGLKPTEQIPTTIGKYMRSLLETLMLHEIMSRPEHCH